MSSVPYPNPQAVFYQQYESVRRDEVVGILLALFLGSFGAHHFYLRRTGLGILYLIFFWSGVPALLGFIECFFMPGRVREYNAIQAAAIASMLGIAMPIWGQPIQVQVNVPSAPQPGTLLACVHCQNTNPPGARFCSSCGAAL
jgi:TM2 domain-containing membrane protein YozV